ncbi:hypothetical protein AKAW_08415 [Aspergillus luchuensis IFO 4308]|nr:hypothetical protein ALUC_40017S [Aspergillus luchuensis]GAA90301.1 hypothetical protein AKAW_08415 [Aspergillus luchuensis IFO 4308]
MVAITASKHHLAIAEIVLFCLVQLIQFITRYSQEWRYWHHTKRKSHPRCIFYAWFGMIGLLAQVRIASAAIVLSDPHPNKTKLIAEQSLQHIGLSPLLFEMSLVLLRRKKSGQTGRSGPGNSRYPRFTRFALHFFRFPVFFGIVLLIVAACTGIRACALAGAIVLLLAFAVGVFLTAWLAIGYRTVLPACGRHCVLLVLCAVPMYTVRIAYALLTEFGPTTFKSGHEQVRVTVGMGLLMELAIITLLFAARTVAEPFWATDCVEGVQA